MGGCCSKDDIDAVGFGSGSVTEEFEGEFLCDDVSLEGDTKVDGARVRLEGSCGFASMYTQQGMKGVNQDAMVLWEDFGVEKGSVYCGVFDGHGPLGHKVAGHVRDNLPSMLLSHLKALAFSEYNQGDAGLGSGNTIIECSAPEPIESIKKDDINWLSSWQQTFAIAFEELDKELSNNTSIDCICSGSTAVSIVKLREHLLVANLGDSRAIIGTRNEKNKLVPVQLTVDLKPNLPDEAERINSCKGRVFALKEEPDVHRIWLPDDDCPGLAMARAFGDFCLKNYGLISTPQLSSWKLTEKDEFVVLATDGLWDVLSNKQVVKTVSSARNHTDAARLLVRRAVRTWRAKYPTSKTDDCAAICLFLKHPCIFPLASSEGGTIPPISRELSFSDCLKTEENCEASKTEDSGGANSEEWSALEGLTRVNSLVKMPRLANVLSWRRRSTKIQEQSSIKENKLGYK